MNIPFKVSSAAGNTFAILDTFHSPEWKALKDLSSHRRSEVLRRLCEDVTPFVDGVFFLSLSAQGSEYSQWDFYNRDGSPAEMCGNAARCAFDYLFEGRPRTPEELFLNTKIGMIIGRKLEDGQIQVQWEIPSLDLQHMKIQLSEKVYEGDLINTGVPHFLVQEMIDHDQAKSLRFHSSFGDQGTNVTFVKMLDSVMIQAWTYERGVEKQTASCGTGAVAAAIWAQKMNFPKTNRFYVKMPGGTLCVDLNLQQNNQICLTSFVERHPDHFFSRSIL